MWEWALGVQPRETAVPRRKTYAVVLAATAVVAAVVYLFTRSWSATAVAASLIGGPGMGWADWRWHRWNRMGTAGPAVVLLAIAVVLQLVVVALRLATGVVDSTWDIASPLCVAICLGSSIPQAVRSHRHDPPQVTWAPDPTGRYPWRLWNKMRWTSTVWTADGQYTDDPEKPPATTLANAPQRVTPSPASAGA